MFLARTSRSGPLLHERRTCDVAYAQMAGIATIGVRIVPFYLPEPKIFSQLLTRANEAKLKSQAGPAYRVVCRNGPVSVGAPRPMKMGTTPSRFPYDAEARDALQSASLRCSAI
jgi:hypothetical protein